MKLHLQINNNGLSYKLVTPSGEEIEGVTSVILPELGVDNNFPEVTVRFMLSDCDIGLSAS